MKKIASLILALVLVSSLCTFANAEEWFCWYCAVYNEGRYCKWCGADGYTPHTGPYTIGEVYTIQDNVTYKCGLQAYDGQIVVECIYDYINLDFGNYATVGLNDKEGIISINGEIVVPIEFSMAYPPCEEAAIVEMDGQLGIYNFEKGLVANGYYSLYWNDAGYFVGTHWVNGNSKTVQLRTDGTVIR